jgi:pantetheine-phosphate adenylyltransferase
MGQDVKAVYPGSFDPPTLGHIDIIARAVKIFGNLTVVVAQSSKKTALFSAEERKKLLIESTAHIPGVTVDIHSGLTVEYVKSRGAHLIIRGLRAVSDFEYELQMATMNRKLFPEIETFVIMTGENYYYISSNTVKEVAVHGGDISQLVPKPVVAAIKKKLNQ